MNKEQFSEHIGNIDDRLIAQADQIPVSTVLRRHKRVRQLLTTAAVLVLMVSSFRVGEIGRAHV